MGRDVVDYGLLSGCEFARIDVTAGGYWPRVGGP